MTDRLKGVVVTFNSDIREDDAESIINAIQMIKGVLKVTPSVRDHNDIMNRSKIKREIEERIWNALRESEDK